MLHKQSYTAMVAATVLAATATLALAQSGASQGTSQPQDKATADSNEAWSKPDVGSQPPAPNGGMSSGAHLGNESPTKPGISGGHQPMSKESKENLDHATSGSR